MQKFDMKPKVIERRTYQVVGLKDGDDIVQFLNVVGAHSSLLDFENARVMKSIRNDVNRIVNAEEANMGKTIEASRSQKDIELIKQAIGFGRLTPPLAEAARIRLENRTQPWLSRAMLKKPIGKSGMTTGSEKAG